MATDGPPLIPATTNDASRDMNDAPAPTPARPHLFDEPCQMQ